MRKPYALAVGFFTMIGCADVGIQAQGTSTDLLGVTESGRPSLNYAYEEAIHFALAEVVAESCRSLSVNTVQKERTMRDLVRRARADGYSGGQFREIARNFDDNRAVQSRIAMDVSAFAKKHGVVDGDEDSVCAAGLAEMKAGSKLGSLLRASA